MSLLPVLPGLKATRIQTPRLETRMLSAGPADGRPVVFVHGNISAATWWEPTLLRMPASYRCLAYDQRGYGEADPQVRIDATRGMADFSEDLLALLDALEIAQAHLVGHSLGGSVLWRFLMDHADRTLSVTQVCPGSPYGFGGCRLEGTPCWPDGAGSGGGTVGKAFVERLQAGDRSDADPQASPRNVLNQLVWKPPFVPQQMEAILSSTLQTHLGEHGYPGDFGTSSHWPGVAPGAWGAVNALSPVYQEPPERLYALKHKPPILWIRGADDVIVSDASLSDFGQLGALGVIPGWPGAESFPPQPMVTQTRTVLDAYAASGGRYEEVVLTNCGHSPYLEQPDAFDRALHPFLDQHSPDA